MTSRRERGLVEKSLLAPPFSKGRKLFSQPIGRDSDGRDGGAPPLAKGDSEGDWGGGPPSSAPKLLLPLLTILLSLTLALLLAEGLVRWAGVAPEVSLIREGRFRLSSNPDLGYEPVPHYEYRGPLTSFHDYSGVSNALGFRDVEHAVERAPGVRRVLVLGDSVAAGQGVARTEDIFPRQLEERLRAAGMAVEVLNFAVSGYNTGQEVAMLAQEGLAFGPDLVLVAYCLNDRRRSDGGILATLRAREQEAGGAVRARYHPWLVHSALYRLLRHRFAGPPEAPEAGPADTREEALAELDDLSREHGFDVLMVIFPRFGNLMEYPPEWGAEHDLVTRMAESHGFAVLDLLPAFQRCRQNTDGRLARDRYHPTTVGHACAGQAVADWLVRRGI